MRVFCEYNKLVGLGSGILGISFLLGMILMIIW